MKTLLYGACLIVLGCATQPTQAPPVPPVPEDLSTWATPAILATTKPTKALEERKPTAAERVYDYTPGTTYAIDVPVGMPVDIIFQAGETIRNIIDGDRGTVTQQPQKKLSPVEQARQATTEELQQGSTPAPQWEWKEGWDGRDEHERPHIFVTVPRVGLTVGLTVTTTRRTYYITCRSVRSSTIRGVFWRYQPEQKPQDTQESLLPLQGTQFHVGYIMEAYNTPPWTPKAIVDDGKKTYIIYPEHALFQSVPLVRLIGPNGPEVVNAGQFLNVVIIDRLISHMELRAGAGQTAEVIHVRRGNLKTITCPGDEECPSWPKAAWSLQERN